MNGLIKNLFAVVFCLALISCGKSEDASTKLPTASDPDQTVAPAAPAAPAAPTPTPDPRIPDFTGSTKVDLTDKTYFTGLEDVAQRGLVTPLVGDPKLVLHLTTGTGFAVSGDLLFGFEDKLGLAAIRVNSFKGAATFQSNTLDAVFASDQIIFRVMGNALSNTGTAYYRMMSSTDTTTLSFTNFNGQAATTTAPYCTELVCKDSTGKTIACPASLTTAVVNACKTYMDVSDTNVKKLGTFQVTLSNWIKLPVGE